MTLVVGTAGHIDHGKTSLLRALTGIDADRLPEERRRGMTIDVGYAHAILPGGAAIDFVDVPGHDGLVGNMLVGAGEIDAALLVVAADDGPRAQTLEHLQLLDALGIRDGLAVVTKVDLVDADRLTTVRSAVEGLLGGSTLAGVPVLAASAQTGEGLAAILAGLDALERRFATARRAAPDGESDAVPRLAVDRVFSVRGHGTVVTGSLRGGGLAAGATVRIEPGGIPARIREIQVHGAAIAGPASNGRTAVNLAAVEAASLRRGQVLTQGPGVEVSDRILVVLRPPAELAPDPDRRWPPADGTQVRLHLGTAQIGARIGRTGREAADLPDGRCTAILRLDEPVAVGVGDPFVLRRPSPGRVVAGGRVLDAQPPRAAARRRVTPDRLARLDAAVEAGAGSAMLDALVEIHGALPLARAGAVTALFRPVHGAVVALQVQREAAGGPASAAPQAGGLLLAPDVVAALEQVAGEAVADHHRVAPLSPGLSIAELRPALAAELRRRAGTDLRPAATAAGAIADRLVEDGRFARTGDRLRDPSRQAGLPPDVLAAMDRLEALLASPAPPPLDEAARSAGCPPDGLRALVAAGRVVRLEMDLAYAAATYQRLADQALAMARRGPLAPAAFRDATGTSRRYVLAVLEDLDRRGILRRTPDGHVPGPKTPPAPPAAPAVAPAAALAAEPGSSAAELETDA